MSGIVTTSGSITYNGDSSARIDSTGSDRAQVPTTGLSPTQSWVAARIKMAINAGDVISVGPTSLSLQPVWTWETGTGFSNDGFALGWYNNLGGSSNGAWWMGRRASGSGNQGAWLGDTGMVVGSMRTVIFKWTSAGWQFSLNGAAFGSVATTNIPTGMNSLMDIGRSAAADYGNGTIGDFYWLAWGSGTLSDADASTINGYGNTDTALASWPGTALGVWGANDATYDDGTPSGGKTGAGIIG